MRDFDSRRYASAFFAAILTAFLSTCSSGGGGGGGLSAPTGLTATAVSHSLVDLSFAESDGAEKYRIYRFGELVAVSSDPDYSDANAPFGTELCYSVAAVNGDDKESPMSGEVCATTPAAPSGTIATWAGTGVQGFNGTGKHPLASWLYNPLKLGFAPDGKAYVFDWNNSVVRRLESDGKFQTVIGTNFPGDWPCQDFTNPDNCIEPLDGTMVGTELNINHWVDLAFQEDETNPAGYTVYFAAWHNHKVTHFDPATGVVTIISGNGQRGFDKGSPTGDGDDPHPAADAYMDFPSAVLLDQNGNLFVAAQRSNRIRRIAPDADRTVITVAGSSEPPTTPDYGGDGGPATQALLALAPYSVEAGADNPEVGARMAMDGQGRLYIVDTSNNCIRRIEPGADGIIGDGDPAEEIIARVAGICGETENGYEDGSALEARFDYPSDIEFGPDGRLYVADSYNNVVRAVDLEAGTVTTVAGTGTAGCSGDGEAAIDARLRRPFGLAFDTDGNLYIADTVNNRIRIVADCGGGGCAGVENPEDDSGATSCSSGIVDDGGGGGSDGGSAKSGTIDTIAGSGLFATNPPDADGDGEIDDPIPAKQANFDLPLDALVGPDGLLYIVEWNGHKVRRLNADGNVQFIAGTGFDGGACEVSLNPDGSCPSNHSQLNHTTDVTFDPQGRMILSAWHNSKIKRVDLGTMSLLDICGNGDRKYLGDGGPCKDDEGNDLAAFDLPTGVVYDVYGNLFISDQANVVIRRIGADGIISTVAGNCPHAGNPSFSFGCDEGEGYSGDGGPAIEAHIKFNNGQETDPQGKIAMDAFGNLFIADTGNHVVRRVTPGADGIIGDGPSSEEIITTVAGFGTPGVGGTAGYAGDNGPATSAFLNGLRDVSFGPDGALYIADTDNHCVRRVDPGPDGVVGDGPVTEEIITTVAGKCGIQGDGAPGDGGPANKAGLNRPYGVHVDAQGNLYIADTLNNRIRIVYK